MRTESILLVMVFFLPTLSQSALLSFDIENKENVLTEGDISWEAGITKASLSPIECSNGNRISIRPKLKETAVCMADVPDKGFFRAYFNGQVYEYSYDNSGKCASDNGMCRLKCEYGERGADDKKECTFECCVPDDEVEFCEKTEGRDHLGGKCMIRCKDEYPVTNDDTLECGFECRLSEWPNSVKNESMYTDRSVFIISGDWRDLLVSIPAVIWTEWNGDIRRYPLLINNGEYTHSLTDFVADYEADKVYIVAEEYEQELSRLLVADRPVGSGISEDNMTEIPLPGTADGGISDRYLRFWESYDTVVYSEDEYVMASAASVYASLMDLPLLIEGYNDNGFDFEDIYVICVGDVSMESGCKEMYETYEDVMDNISYETETDKLIPAWV